jgi:hypothetical protein
LPEIRVEGKKAQISDARNNEVRRLKMPRGMKISGEDLLVKVLGLFTFESAYKSALLVSDRFVDVDGTLKTVSAKGKKGTMTVLSYEDCPDIDIFDAATENATVLVVRPKISGKESEKKVEADDLLASFENATPAPEPAPDPELTPTAPKGKKGVSVRPE